MASQEKDMLKMYWEYFFKAETGTYEKSTWLDLFLAEFLIRVNEGAYPEDLINFCPVSGVVSLVGCELLCGIHRVTSSISAHYPAPLPRADTSCSGNNVATVSNSDAKENEGSVSKSDESKPTSLFTRANTQSSAEILRKYLLGGVAWRCLVLLKVLGVEGMSCCRQLSSVLMWLYSELGGGGGTRNRHVPQQRARLPLYQLFSHRIWSKQKISGSPGCKVSSTASSERDSVTGRSRQTAHTKLDITDKIKRKTAKQTDPSSESCDSNDDLQILNRSMAIKVNSPNDDFEYFNSPVRSTIELLYTDPFYTPKQTKPKADDYMNEKHREIINSEITTFEFTLITTDLLQELCKAESSLSGSEGSQISVQCINFSLRNLCSLQFGSLPACSQQYDAQEVSRIKVALTELLIVSLDKVLIRSDLCAKLINNGILPMLLRLLEDVICKSSSKYHTKLEDQYRAKEITIEKPDPAEAGNMLKFVFGVAYSVTAFFHCLLMQCRSVDNLKEFTEQFKLYGECLKGGLLKECIELMIRIPGVDQEESVVLIKKLIESIGKLVNGMKKVRSEIIHSAACPKSRHKMCRQRVAAGMHHHHDILGEASSGLRLSSTCCVSILYGTLTSLVTDDEVSAHASLRNKILRVTLNCGVCCCFSPGFLMECIVRLMLTHNNVASLCLQLLEHTVYGELGASVLVSKVPTDQLPCSICEPSDDKRDTAIKYCPYGMSPERKSIWSFLIHYNSLLQLDNHNNVLYATVSHLLRVTPKCRTEMKYELLFSVVYPTFIVSKHRYMIKLEESAYFLTVSCLNIFASLLNTVSFADHFIQKGGLSYVLELVALTEFSKQCCSILEIAIIVEIFKLMKGNSEPTYIREISSLASVQMLLKSLSKMTEKCYKIYKLKLPGDKFEDLCDVTKEQEVLALSSTRRASELLTRKLSTPKAIKTPFAISENVTEESIEDYIEVLKNVWTFWKSCAALCLYSPMFRQYIVSEDIFVDSYALLKVLLNYLCNCECSAVELKVLIKIIEALLTVQFAVFDVSEGKSSECSSAAVRCQLEGAARAPGAAVRALCEALARVAAAEPSPTHAMPPLTHAKVPPLVCPSGSSSPAGSSSEDSDSGPYASERSDPDAHLADDGYEADIEIGKLDLLSSYKTGKVSGSLSAMNNASDVTGASSGAIETAARTRSWSVHGGSTLAHPDLCIIIVDTLAHIVRELLNPESPEASQEEVRRTAASVARACSPRLADAPPALLQRLLAPPFTALLTATDSRLEEVQRAVMEAVQGTLSRSVEAAQLAALLRVARARLPAARLALAALRRLAAAAPAPAPDTLLTFPVRAAPTDYLQSSVLLSQTTLSGATSQSHQAEATARRLRESHIQAGVTSSWTVAGVRCGLEGAGWAPWLHGFALTAWLRPADALEPSRDDDPDRDCDSLDEWHAESVENELQQRSSVKPVEPRDLAHLVSLGHDSLMFETWLDATTGVFVFRLTRPELTQNRILSEAAVASSLCALRWSFVALNVREVVHRKRIHIQVTLYVNGCECETVSLPLQGILVRKAQPTNVLIGHACHGDSTAVGAYHTSGVHVYRAPALSAYTALHLAAHGPDHACQVRCESPNFPSVLTPEMLDSNIDWDQVYDMSRVTLRELHDNLLLTYSAQSPNIMNLYHQTVALPTVLTGRVSSAGSLMASTGSGMLGGGSTSIPEALHTVWTGVPLASRHRGLAPALYMLGGPDVMLYLFARVVELEGSVTEQASALWVLLRTCSADARLYAALYGESGLDLLHTVLAAPCCELSPQLLQVIFEEACGAPVVSCGTGGVVLSARADAVLREPRLLLFLIHAWRHLDTGQEWTWEMEGPGGTHGQCSGSLWALTLSGMLVLLADDHPRRSFNYYQMTRLDLLRHLLRACKERYLSVHSEQSNVAEEAGDDRAVRLVELVRALAGAPPPPAHLALIADFLLLMHQASDTFVTHSRANFYFLLTPESPETSTFNAHTSKRKSSRRPKTRSQTGSHSRPSSNITEKTPSDNIFSATKDKIDISTNDDKVEPDSSVDSTKHMKGIINMQIKEGRKYNTSTASENSDIGVDEGTNVMGLLESDTVAKGTEHEGYEGEESEQQNVHRSMEHDIQTGIKHNSHDRIKEKTHEDVGQEMEVLIGNKGVGNKSRETNEGLQESEKYDEVLKEYIVVDEDEVKHNTVEMYTSGIYQQQHVMLGAATGWPVCEGLLLLLRDCVRLLPDHALLQTLCGAIQAEWLVALANHRSVGVRCSLLRLVAALQRRAPPELAKRLLQRHYYVHLANQISLYPGSWELATACAALLTQCDVPLSDQLDEDIWMDIGEEAAVRAAPLLAVLDAALTPDGGAPDVPLVHNITLIVRKIIDKTSLKALGELSVAEVCVRCVRSVGRTPQFEGRNLLLEDLNELLNRIAIKALAIQHSMQTILDVHYMLTYMENADEDQEVRVASREAQAALFLAQLDYLEERLHTSYTAQGKHANYFTTVLSSAVSLGTEGVSRTELSTRHASAVTRAVSFLVSQSPADAVLSAHAETALFDRLLTTLLLAVSGPSAQRPKWWSSGSADWAGALQELFWWAAAPTQPARALQPRLLHALYRAPPATTNALTPLDPNAQRKLAVYLLTMVKAMHLASEDGAEATVELAVTDWAREWAVATQAALPARLPAAALEPEAQRLLSADEEQRQRNAHKHRTTVAKVVFNKEWLCARVTESAMSLTRQAVEAQNAARKAFMEHLRRAQAHAAARHQRWRRLIDAYTHEQALWHDPNSYPQSWQLDPTEGPGRVRVRLRRAHLNIHPRFLKPEFQLNAETIHRPAPLESVVGGKWGLQGGLVARLQLDETVSHMARVTYVTVASETLGELLLSDRAIHFVPEELENDSSDNTEHCISAERQSAVSWPLETVTCVLTRRWCLQERAAELFLSSGHAHLLAFADQQERTAFLKALNNCHLPNRLEPDTLQEAMSAWRSGSITNWEYLMRLNGLAGRSYNDLMQYPVLPYVLADYSARILDLTHPGTYRDLCRPMAIQNRNREKHYINTYNDLAAARRSGCSALVSRAPHHYASLYSNSGGVLHYLVRLPPFTELFLNYQDNNFDMPDRTFHSLATTWRLITNDSPTDVKELIPELFYLPELFYNREGLNLGIRQCGAAVDDVELPPWAADGRLFTLIHRQALESPHVTETLSHWIDLVFGYKQTGQAAIDAINVFPACTYYGFDPYALEDEVERTAAAAMVRTYGQAPRQLLRQPHPHPAPDLHTAPADQPSVWAGVEGARWGRYCGAPGSGVVVAARRRVPAATALHVLPAPRAAAVASANTALLAMHDESVGCGPNQTGSSSGLALLSWGHSDNIVRLKRRRDTRPDLLLHIPALDQITCVNTTCSPGGHPALLGLRSGRVLALWVQRPRPRSLHAHSAPIADMFVCVPMAIIVTADVDGKIVLWDLNKLSYIRTLPNRDMLPVTHVTVSETLCDVASVHEVTSRVPSPLHTSTRADSDSESYEKDAAHKYKSLIRVHTVNASFVGSVKVSDRVTCVCYSNAAEGAAVNCVAGGLAGGGVRLYSSWDLRPVAYIPPAHAPAGALLSLTYSSDSQILFGCYADSVVVAWEGEQRTGGRSAPIRIHAAHALF